MNELAKIDHKEFGLEEKQATEIVSGLNQILEERKVLSEMYSEVINLEITEENLIKFRELRLKIRDNRTKGIQVWHKVNKEFYLRGGQFVDAIKNKEIAENERMESNLEQNENHFERMEKERKHALNEERKLLLIPYIDSVDNLQLHEMDFDVWDAFLSTKKLKFEENLAEQKRIEAEKLEAERIEKERIEAQRIENERLKIEAEKREKEIQAERERVEKENKERIEKERIEAEKLAKIQAEEKAKQDEILRKEREEKEKLEKELQAKKDAEIQAEKQRLAKIESDKLEAEKLAKAPIKKQLKVWVDSFKIENAPIENDLSNDINLKFESFKKWAESQINNL